MKITMDKDRRILRIECDEFAVKFNGKPNTVYRDMLAPMGIELKFEESEGTDVSSGPVYDYRPTIGTRLFFKE